MAPWPSTDQKEQFSFLRQHVGNIVSGRPPSDLVVDGYDVLIVKFTKEEDGRGRANPNSLIKYEYKDGEAVLFVPEETEYFIVWNRAPISFAKFENGRQKFHGFTYSSALKEDGSLAKDGIRKLSRTIDNKCADEGMKRRCQELRDHTLPRVSLFVDLPGNCMFIITAGGNSQVQKGKPKHAKTRGQTTPSPNFNQQNVVTPNSTAFSSQGSQYGAWQMSFPPLPTSVQNQTNDLMSLFPTVGTMLGIDTPRFPPPRVAHDISAPMQAAVTRKPTVVPGVQHDAGGQLSGAHQFAASDISFDRTQTPPFPFGWPDRLSTGMESVGAHDGVDDVDVDALLGDCVADAAAGHLCQLPIYTKEGDIPNANKRDSQGESRLQEVDSALARELTRSLRVMQDTRDPAVPVFPVIDHPSPQLGQVLGLNPSGPSLNTLAHGDTTVMLGLLASNLREVVKDVTQMKTAMGENGILPTEATGGDLTPTTPSMHEHGQMAPMENATRVGVRGGNEGITDEEVQKMIVETLSTLPHGWHKTLAIRSKVADRASMHRDRISPKQLTRCLHALKGKKVVERNEKSAMWRLLDPIRVLRTPEASSRALPAY
eukprot:comp23318_c0_seq2/m.38341 comp23318_c0_seq2/g.38341  ORF comp23318_c0_seq2/g.38341 comp23318_c0_seq2/m.38341 type:complete len:598 (-) comp23318_c0_seq2:987-2780(-)